MSPDEMVQLGAELVAEAEARGAQARVYGGTAIYARCPSIKSHSTLARAYADLDLIADSPALTVIKNKLTERGLALKKQSEAATIFANDTVSVDVRPSFFREYFSFDLSSRLRPGTTTLPLEDLVLLKLQRVAFADKDMKDAIALLLDHRVMSGQGDESIDRDYVCSLTNRNWGLWTAVFDNTVAMEKALDRYVEPDEAQLVWRRIELIQEVLDGRGKSLGWWARALIGKKYKWYRDPKA